MIDRYNRWCLFYDCELVSSPREGPAYLLHQLIDPLLRRVREGLSKKLLDRDSRIVRISEAETGDVRGHACLKFVVTMGNQRAADPSFVHFHLGTSRDADRRENEVKGGSAHCLLRLTPTAGHPTRHLLMIEQTTGLGRTTIERLLNSEFEAIATGRGDNFTSPVSGRPISVRPIVHLSGHKSEQMEEALRTGTFAPIELIDTTPDPTWDEQGKFRLKRRIMRVDLVAPPGERREALEVLSARARQEGYGRMRITWKAPGAQRGNESEIDTDLADVGEALFSKRKLIFVEAGMSECSHTLRRDFIDAMAAEFG